MGTIRHGYAEVSLETLLAMNVMSCSKGIRSSQVDCHQTVNREEAKGVVERIVAELKEQKVAVQLIHMTQSVTIIYYAVEPAVTLVMSIVSKIQLLVHVWPSHFVKYGWMTLQKLLAGR